MENTINQKCISGNKRNRGEGGMRWGAQKRSKATTQLNGSLLTSAKINREYTVKAVETNNSEVQDFLFTLGCYAGEAITVVSILADQYVVVVKDARYSIDRDLAECIVVN